MQKATEKSNSRFMECLPHKSRKPRAVSMRQSRSLTGAEQTAHTHTLLSRGDSANRTRTHAGSGLLAVVRQDKPAGNGSRTSLMPSKRCCCPSAYRG